MINENITVRQVTKIFKQLQELEAEYNVFDKLADFASLNTELPIDNDSYMDALLLTDYMFKRTSNNILMLTGHDNEVCFLETLKDTFIETLERIKNNGGKVKIIFIAESVPESIKTTFEKYYNSTLECIAVKLKNDYPVKHFIACDSRMVREEDIHPTLTDASPANIIKAKMYFNNKTKNQINTSLFNLIWAQVKGK